MKNIKLFIWDFDGTLMDTYPFTTQCLQKALIDRGFEVSQTDILEKMMVNIPHAIRYYEELYGTTGLSESFYAYHAKESEAPVLLFPGVKEVLASVKESGADNYIFTNRGDTVLPMLEKAGIAHMFKEVVKAGDPNFVVKPAPDTINYLMAKYGGDINSTVMIGDRVCDLESGYNANCRTCHLFTKAVPQYPKCDWRINDFYEMLELLK